MGKIENELCLVFGLPHCFVHKRIINSSRYYTPIAIPKKNGEFRIIEMPTPEMKLFQKFILGHYLEHIPISEFASAYVKNKNLVSNLYPHINNLHFLHMDIRHFFDSIKTVNLLPILRKERAFDAFSNDDLKELADFLSFGKRLCQGAVTTPCLSNIYLRDFDAKIAKLVSFLPHGEYSRYSDDITISSAEKIPYQTEAEICRMLDSFGLKANRKKCYFSSSKRSSHITGLNIVDQRISVGTQEKRKIKSHIYQYLRTNKSSPSIDLIRGELAYLKMSQPTYYQKIYLKFRKWCRQEQFSRLQALFFPHQV